MTVVKRSAGQPPPHSSRAHRVVQTRSNRKQRTGWSRVRRRPRAALGIPSVATARLLPDRALSVETILFRLHLRTATQRATNRARVRKGSASARTARLLPDRAPAARLAPTETLMATDKELALCKRCVRQELNLWTRLLLHARALLAIQLQTFSKKMTTTGLQSVKLQQFAQPKSTKLTHQLLSRTASVLQQPSAISQRSGSRKR